ncbi:DNA polymerase II large subunit [Candidatus Woesearchaeota archaeon]|nr:DNA polymerase II large subunit [Candidatus Woesearchaeota archaeon]
MITKDIASEKMKEYFSSLSEETTRCYDAAELARKKGLDPESEVNIPLAKNMAERVVGLISVVAPQLVKTNLTERIGEMETEYGMLDWRVGFCIAVEVAKEKFCTFKDKLEAMETGIRVGFAYLTLGIVSAPLEGFVGLKIKKRRDGKEYFALQYAGPIRGAGGTAASTSVILADYVRVKMGYAPYDPDELEINRYASEVHDYHERVTNLQYHPSDDELKFMVKNLPVEVDGDPTEKREVSNYKDVPRIETNLIRGGVALVLAEGLCQKAPKLWKRLSKWGKEFELQWDFLAEFLALKEKIHAEHQATQKKEKVEEKKKVKANTTYIMDLVAGRPILTHPLREGGFRIRYGRARTTGFSAAALHPATMVILNNYIAIGTQLKVERPGKAATVAVCDSIEGPIVLLNDGDFLQLNSEEEAKKVFSEIKEIVFLGDILFNYGDFSENGQSLVPPGYCPEWWALEVKKSLEMKITEEKEKSGDKSGEKKQKKEFSVIKQLETLLKPILNNPLSVFPSVEEAIRISQKLDVALHPAYLFYWKLISAEQLEQLLSWLKEGKVKTEVNTQGTKEINKMVLPFNAKEPNHLIAKRVLELLGVEHKVINKESVVIEKVQAQVLALCLNINSQEELRSIDLSKHYEHPDIKMKSQNAEKITALDVLALISQIKLKDKAGTFIGARMGRPEKAKMRAMTGSPQVMFPVGEEGDRLRSFQATVEHGKVHSTFPLRYCEKCQRGTIYPLCEACSSLTVKRFNCRFCGDLDKETCRHGSANPFKAVDLDIKYYFDHALQSIGAKTFPDLIKGIRGTSNKGHVVEHLVKGILRAKHSIYVNKDGTTRYDCTEMPITHFKPKEIKTSVEKLCKLGYEKDIYGKELTLDNQLLELKPQDVILPGFNSLDESSPKVLSRVANFIDELLIKFYGQNSFYNIKKEEDLVGHLVIGLAPHISAGLIGRIIGFSETQALITSPMYHAGMRRDCDGDEACVMLLMDALLNFSRQYLPERRGAKTMDSPLVLTAILYPSEVDDQVHGIDVVWKYPLEFYEAALEMKKPWEIKVDGKKIEQLGDRLNTPQQYENFGFTHSVEDFNKGVQCSAYKLLPSMEEKLIGQMDIAEKVRAVDMDDVAKLVIQKHLLKDIKGNLRKFSMQQFRCVGCNAKYRRPPLKGKCTACNGRIIFTISEGSVTKYLGHSLLLAERYDFSPYLKQTLNILKSNIDNVFGKEKEKQVGLAEFVE